jgi:hypothetical protein
MHARRLGALLVLAATLPAVAQDAPYGDTYTAEELAALDTALEAGNLVRHDLTFDKALTKGHGCFPVVKEMLWDPLRIAPGMDAIVARQRALGDGASASTAALLSAAELFVPEDGRTPLLPVVDLAPDTSSPEALAASLAEMLQRQPRYESDLAAEGEDVELVLDALRLRLPAEMAWHDVFEAPFDGERKEAAEAWRKDDPAAVHEAAARIGERESVRRWIEAFGDPPRWLAGLPAAAFPQEEPLVVETAHGRVALGTPGDDVFTGEFAALIDPGGDDRYVDCRIGGAQGTAGRRVGFFADLGGDDRYECADVNVSLGAAVLGVAAFYDLGAGDDRYEAGHATLGAAMAGVAVFHDDGGTDVYEGRTFTEGAAGFGVGVFLDDSVQEEPETSSDEGTKEPVDIRLFDNDHVTAWGNAQAFARPRGVALCINRRGNDTYQAGGVYLHAPLFSDRYQSFSQGFSIGSRGIDWAGGIAMVIDHDGNDRYLGDIYNQGVGYWYGAGFVWDGGGNDTYEMTQYGQGSGIHLAIGGLVDVDGHDTYVMHSGLGQGGSHDYAASILHDRGGNDRYHGSTSCNGCGLTNSVGIQIDRAGDDTYGARRKSGVNFGRPARDFPSIGILVDLAGTDDYLGVMDDGAVWRHTDIGVGIDVTPADTTASGGGTPAADQPSGEAEIPDVCSYEGDLTQEVFDELWEISVRWEVGDNRVIVPRARERLVAFGPGILPMLDAKVETDNSGLELRAFYGILRGLSDGGARDAVLDFLRSNAAHESERRRTVALRIVHELKVTELEGAVVAILSGDDDGLARRAASTLGALDSRAGDEVLIAWLSSDDPRKQSAAIGVLVPAEVDCWNALMPLMDHDDFSVRMRLVTHLSRHLPAYREGVISVLGWELTDRARRCAFDVMARSKEPPDVMSMIELAPFLLDDNDGLRASSARVVRHWETLEGVDREILGDLVKTADKIAAEDPVPYVRWAAMRR